MQKQSKSSVRLGSLVFPTHYTITLKPDLESHVFEGEETITLTITKPTKEITLHSKDLNILSAVVSVGKENIPAEDISYDAKKETATFAYPRLLLKGSVKLHIVFQGVLADNMRGFYKSKYVVEGKDRWMATTQFEATDARRCIPCFDEPTHKAVFDVHLVIPNTKTAISNTLPHTIKEHEAGYKIVSFESTPKMSTYLLAFIVGDFEYLEGETKRGVKVRVFTTPGKKKQGKFALDCGVRALDFFESYFGIKYPLPVLDMIAIPDFASGAMENWGAVTYRQTILIDEKNSSLANRQWIAIVVAHELAHQWFGNLVTMEWWTDLWLNEGFASYIEYLATDALFPQWNIWSQFLLSDHGPALRLDALLHTHPIEVEVHHPDEIGEIFDEVSYSKGAAVIRMLAEYMGEKNFRTGLQQYLKAHSYKNTRTIDLWESFEKASKLPIKKMMQAWTRTPGYPVVSVSKKGEKLILSQERFFMSPLSEIKAKSTQRWMIPVAVETNRGKQKPVLMSARTVSVPKPVNGWIKLNPTETALFRTAYSKELLADLKAPISNQILSPIDRLGVIRDLFALAESGKKPTTDFFEMLGAYTQETEYIVWGEILSGLGKINHLFSDAVYNTQIKKYALEVVSSRIEFVGWKKKANENSEMTFLRSAVLYAAGQYGHVQTIEMAQKLFKQRIKDIIDPDLRGVVYALVAENGTEKEWAELAEMYREASVNEEKNRISRALAQFTSEKLLKKTLAFSLGQDVRSQDSPTMIAHVLGNKKGTHIGWDFIQKNWKELLKRYSSGGHMLPRLIAPLAFFSDTQKAKEIKAFFKKNPVPGAARTLLQVDEKILLNAAWKKRDGKNIQNWLKSLPQK
jgi:puromycin-sensitive aminopeptidase